MQPPRARRCARPRAPCASRPCRCGPAREAPARTHHPEERWRAMSELRVLNAYAGIGGNRHLWPAEWHVTAVEIDPRVAAEYARRYPNDTVLVEDAHAHVIERAHEYDARWSSPPCPTHSRLALNVARRKGTEPAPDPRLWAEIEHLRALDGRYVVENVHTYYAPPIPPDVVTERHYYWTSAPPLTLTPVGVLPVSGPAHGTDGRRDRGELRPPVPAGRIGRRPSQGDAKRRRSSRGLRDRRGRVRLRARTQRTHQPHERGC